MWTPEVCPNCKTDYSVIPGFPFQELAYGSWEDTVQEVKNIMLTNVQVLTSYT